MKFHLFQTTSIIFTLELTNNMIKNNYIDLFCGAGGLSIGLERAGLNLLYSSDIDKTSTDTLKHNFKKINPKINENIFIQGDIMELYKHLGTKRVYRQVC